MFLNFKKCLGQVNLFIFLLVISLANSVYETTLAPLGSLEQPMKPFNFGRAIRNEMFQLVVFLCLLYVFRPSSRQLVVEENFEDYLRS
mmetsp:Transcript_37744/g.57795  ORF Transcript_37744/g.57795 Transcript_37744/m.57795 type:complete len:88 (+) Transcript_37744:74-337(+)